ncbi:MAG: patatin-like phospholipase family protein, partial [Peptoniphilus harei]|nr:patatin-like phospholipase family protein [Peptoniphilus harei]
EEESLKYIYRILKDKFENSENELVRKVFEEHVPKIAEELELPETFGYDELLYKLLEKEAEKKKIDRFKIYTVDELMREIKNGF